MFGHLIMKKWVIGIVVVVALLGGCRVGSRWCVLRKMYCHADVKHRMSIVPSELDLSDVQVAGGVTCDVGYAEFIIPSTDSVQLKSSASGAVLGETEAFSFAFLIPFDPSAPDKKRDEVEKELTKLPQGHPLREELAGPGKTFLDLQIYAERIVPDRFWKTVFQDSTLFAVNTRLLYQKGSTTGLGMHRVHTYHTPETRGLVLVGKEAGDLSTAHATLVNRSGTQAVGMHICTLGDGTNDVMQIMSVILKTFKFTVENLNSGDDVKKIIAEAGILSREEEKESPTKPSTATE